MKLTAFFSALCLTGAVLALPTASDLNVREPDPADTDTVSFVPCTRAFCGGGYIKRDDGSSASLPLYIKRDGTSQTLYIRDTQAPGTDTVSFVPCARAFCGGGYIK
ncbi:hypothetical protein PV04_10418 [Phialophora macrospora]|uniref:Uncharacterized protein n=1 Tax=Phialophora macrospora TaxID=1851006 RepID=A0A0D2F2Q3_9EURO|nr:hypothetical protein PV04_10418 [Phialophora macrospora]